MEWRKRTAKVSLNLAIVRETKRFTNSWLLEHGYCHQLLDDCQFWNHSDTPNTGNHGPDPYNCYALRDIRKGEELFDDYGTYEWPDWYIHLLTEYNVDVDYFTVPDKNRYRNLDISGMVAIECN